MQSVVEGAVAVTQLPVIVCDCVLFNLVNEPDLIKNAQTIRHQAETGSLWGSNVVARFKENVRDSRLLEHIGERQASRPAANDANGDALLGCHFDDCGSA